MIRNRMQVVVLTLATAALAACGDDGPSGPSTLNCTGGAALSVGANVGGTLQDGDQLDIDGAYLDRYALTVSQSGTIEITMRSTQLDAFLWLLDDEGAEIEQDDDDGGGVTGFDAQIVRTLSRGCYLIDATTWPDETGSYTLTVTRE